MRPSTKARSCSGLINQSQGDNKQALIVILSTEVQALARDNHQEVCHPVGSKNASKGNIGCGTYESSGTEDVDVAQCGIANFREAHCAELDAIRH